MTDAGRLTGDEAAGPPGDFVAVIVGLWRDCGADPDGDGFFTGGGNSLSAIRLLGAVYRETGRRPAWDDLDGASDAAGFAARVYALDSADRS